jgi:23S rRNA (uracil1939-C5)-methyltransferase
MGVKHVKHETFIDDLSHDGRGVAHIQGKAVFISGALPEETVQYRVTRSHKHYDEACVENILQPSLHRTTPACPHYEHCGGCVLQHLDPHQQLKVKELAFWKTLKKIGQVEPQIQLPAIESNPWHYRHRAKLHVQTQHQEIKIGFKSKLNARKVIGIHHCPILMESLEKLLPYLNQLLHAFEQAESVETILIAKGKEAVSLLFCCKRPLQFSDLALLQQFGEMHECHIFIQLQPNQIQSVFPKQTLDQMTYPFPHLDLTLKFSANDFTQVNVSANELMLKAAKDMMSLDEHDVVGDLFCGLGNFSLYLAPWVKQVIGAEMSEQMIHAASQNANLNALTNLKFECLDLNDAVAVRSFFKLHQMNKLILDPPRAGALTVAESISKSKINGLLYVSCHPATLARDAKILVQKGFVLKAARVIDMFPQTGHIEGMAWFERL